jgi:hypothetical protein
MNEVISYCGLLCKSCPIYLATREKNELKKKELIFEIIRACKAHYGIEYRYEDINDCDGCISNSEKLFIGCSDCKIRKCASQKEIENCAYCNDYPCDNLNDMLNSEPEARKRLDGVRSYLE